MIPYAVYKLVHYAGIFLILIALGGITTHVASGGTRENFKLRKWAGMLHGIGLFLALLGGFGALARLYGGAALPAWLYPKLLIWILLGLAPVVLYRARGAAKILWLVIVALAITAGGFALYKPFTLFGAATETSAETPAASPEAGSDPAPSDTDGAPESFQEGDAD